MVYAAPQATSTTWKLETFILNNSQGAVHFHFLSSSNKNAQTTLMNPQGGFSLEQLSRGKARAYCIIRLYTKSAKEKKVLSESAPGKK